MTDIPPPPEPAPESAHPTHELPEPAVLPKWVPLLIGIVLVGMAALAVFTGLRYRTNTLVNIVRPTRARPLPRSVQAPPGEPEAGASLVFPGEAGDNAPTASEPVTGKARAVITGGGAEGITAAVRIWARRGMTMTVVPDDAVVYVNDVPIGQASQFNAPDEIYDFPQPGSYTVRLTAPGYHDQLFVITASDTAKTEIARLDAKLKKE